MIWWSLFRFFLFFTLKPIIFVRNLCLLDLNSMFIMRIFPLVLLIILGINFSTFLLRENFYYLFLFTLRVAFVCFTFIFDSTFLFLMFLEASSIPMLLLILNYSKGQDKVSSLIFIFFINFSGSMPFFFFSIMKDGESYVNFLDPFYSFFYLFCFFLLLRSKVPIFLLHFWLTKAHVRASGSCSMLLARLILKLGTFGLLKFSSFFCSLFRVLGSFLFRIGSFSCVLLTWVMARFFDVKLLVACSSIMHISMILPFSSDPMSYPYCGRVMMMVGHGLISYYIFYLVTLLYEFSLNRSYDFAKAIESSSKSLSTFFFLFMFLNLGLPPFVSFLRELSFCLGLYLWAFSRLFIFGLRIVLRIIFLMFMVTKGSFGKSYYLGAKIESSLLVVNSIFYFVSLSVCLFFFYCLFSLI